MKKLSIIAVMLLVATTASAQFANSNATRTATTTQVAKSTNEGYNRFEFSYNPTFAVYQDGWTYDGSAFQTLNGFTFGYLRGINLAKSLPLYLEVGGQINYSFDLSIEDEYTTNLSYMNLSVPVNVSYRIKFGNSNISFQPYTGFYLKANLLGQYSVLDNDGDYDSISFFDKDEVNEDIVYNRIQVGWQAGVGFNFNKFYVGLKYGVDFNGLADVISTSNFAATIGFTF